MRKRNAVDSAEWSIERAESYRKMCDEILYRNDWLLIIEEQKVYVQTADEKILLAGITQPKTIWFETWLKLREL